MRLHWRTLAMVVATALLAVPALAQEPVDRKDDGLQRPVPRIDPEDFLPVVPELPDEGLPEIDLDAPQEPEPELTREERFDKLFVELSEAETDEDAAFIAEEIEALWRDSGSATVDLLTDRASDALDMGDAELARELISGAIELGPDHGEAWAVSALIAMAEDELGVALEHIERAVSLEPRHYLALTRLGLILERLEATQGAYDAYERALELNPRLPVAREGAERTERAARGREL